MPHLFSRRKYITEPNMEDYSKYRAEDLLQDEGFLNYCRSANLPDMEKWEQFLREHPSMAPVVMEAKRLFQLLSITASDEEKQAGAQKLKAAIESELDDLVPARHRLGWTRWAAAAAVLAVTASLLFFYLKPVSEKGTAVADYRKAGFTEKAYASGEQIQTIHLPDGSVVELNRGSTLKLAVGYGQKNRWLYLEGEAFFAVSKDTEKPFVVITRRAATTALGTSFKVKQYASQSSGNVMLATGKVKVEDLSRQQNMILLPGEEVIWDSLHQATSSSFDPDLISQWRKQELVFDRTGLKEIVSTLEFYYGVSIQLENDPTSAIAFTGRFTKQPLQEVLEAIAFANKFDYSRKGNIISIRFK
ncbi:MAG: DUF4974 domain-containing protein [Chitinophagaceae bacterium]|nr:DUF4974 domain-containing protein [Chitinophagaceae bacterium]